MHTCHATANPFDDLDIVMHCNGGEIGIVKDSKDTSAGSISVLFEYGYVLAVSPMCLEKVERASEFETRERAVKVIREQLKRFDDKKRVILEKTIEELSGFVLNHGKIFEIFALRGKHYGKLNIARILSEFL